MWSEGKVLLLILFLLQKNATPYIEEYEYKKTI